MTRTSVEAWHLRSVKRLGKWRSKDSTHYKLRIPSTLGKRLARRWESKSALMPSIWSLPSRPWWATPLQWFNREFLELFKAARMKFHQTAKWIKMRRRLRLRKKFLKLKRCKLANAIFKPRLVRDVKVKWATVGLAFSLKKEVSKNSNLKRRLSTKSGPLRNMRVARAAC